MDLRDHLSITMINDKIKKMCKEGTLIYDTRDGKAKAYKVLKVYPYHVCLTDDEGFTNSFTNSEIAIFFEKFDKEEEIMYRKEVK